MFEKWSKYNAEQVKTDYDENGVRLILSFARDYKRIFNVDICHNCKDFKNKYQKFLKTTSEMKNQDKKNSGFVLKKMYENIPLSFGSRVYVNNDNMTDEYALELIKGHPRGKDLFQTIPDSVDLDEKEKLTPVEQLVKDNDKPTLKKMAEGLGITDLKGNKTQLATLIIDAQNTDNADNGNTGTDEELNNTDNADNGNTGTDEEE